MRLGISCPKDHLVLAAALRRDDCLLLVLPELSKLAIACDWPRMNHPLAERVAVLSVPCSTSTTLTLTLTRACSYTNVLWKKDLQQNIAKAGHRDRKLFF